MDCNDTNTDKTSEPATGETDLPTRTENYVQGDCTDVDSPVQAVNRRCSLRPRKRSGSDIIEASQEYVQSPKQQCRKRTKHQALETIFEEPVVKNNGQVLLLGLSKVKRYISFSQFVSKTKLKKRKQKMKKLKLLRKTDKKKLSYSPLQEVEGKLTRLDI